MNLALQTRRAVVTLSLLALAMVCVAAKTATRDVAFSVDVPPPVATVAQDSLDVSTGAVAVRIAEPVVMIVKAKARARCDGKIVRL